MRANFWTGTVVAILSSIVSGLIVYWFLSYLLISPNVNLPLSIAMSIMTFGLTTYYSRTSQVGQPHETSSSMMPHHEESENNKRKKNQLSGVIFAVIYAIIITTVLVAPNSYSNSQIFAGWNNLSVTNIVKLAFAIMLTFFVPGYAIALIAFKKYRIKPIAFIIFSYLISILVSGVSGFVLSLYFDFPISDSKIILISMHTAILISFIIIYNFTGKIGTQRQNQSRKTFSRNLICFAKNNTSELLVFGGIFLILVVYSYYLFGGVTVGDQWFHQGRALLFMSGSIKESALTGADDAYYPPLHSAILAIITLLSGVPVVNAYASIAFLNIVYVFSFYYFFPVWIQNNLQRSNLIATTLFTISSGFGWIYLLSLTMTTNPIVSQNSVLDTIVSTEPFDVFQPTNFFSASHPDFSSPLIYIALPAGFFLLGVIREGLRGKFTFTSIVTAISLLGILSHDEFYLFIIVGCILPIFFPFKKGNYIYLGFFIAIASVFLIDAFSPAKYYTSNEIFPGFSLLILGSAFVAGTWAVYTFKRLVRSLIKQIQRLLQTLASKNTEHNLTRPHKGSVALGLLIISAVSYFYFLSFIVLGHLSINDIITQSAGYGGPYNVPWYLYPLKLGITGALGTASILSYIFRKFEKEIFIFGIIGIVALFSGPYYDEHRFSKYILSGMSGFAGIFVYKILVLFSHRISIAPAIIIPLIIILASASSFIYIGFNSLILQTGDFTHTLNRRDFPESEMPLFQTLRDKLDIESNRYNVLTFSNEYSNLDNGLVAQLQGFVGLPSNIIYQNPVTMNVTHLDSFYHLLVDSGIRFIILPKHDFTNKFELTKPVQFALEHFGQIYQDKKYIVLEVPRLGPVSDTTNNDIALIYDQNKNHGQSSPRTNAVSKLDYDDSTFNFNGKTNFVVLHNGNKTEKVILSDYDSSEGINLWSRPITSDEKINYAEVGFRIINENFNKSKVVGFEWITRNGKEYHLSFSYEGLRLFEKTSKNGTKLVYENAQIGVNILTNYTLKLERFQNSTNIFVNDRLVVNVPEIPTINSEPEISQIGIRSSNATVEFTPIKIGIVSNGIFYTNNAQSDYYYPLSIAALSENGYDIFSDKDPLALSKKQLLLSFDPTDWDNTTFDQYLTHVRNGGKLIVFNSDFTSGKFGQLISLRNHDNNNAEFNAITGRNNQSISVSGVVNRIEIEHSPDITVISRYSDKAGNTIAPFLIEKSFSRGGKILLVNSDGYFDALSKTTGSNFLSLLNISTILGLDKGNSHFSNNISRDITAQPLRFIGNFPINGSASLKTSSLLFPEPDEFSHNMHAERILIADKKTNHTRFLENVTFHKLKLEGLNDITVNSNGTITLPSKYSEMEYIGVTLHTKFDIISKQHANQTNWVKFVALNGSSHQNYDLNNVSVIFYNVGYASAAKPVLFLLKSPEVDAKGHIGLKTSNFDRHFRNDAIPLDVKGKLKAKFDFVDDLEQRFSNGTTKTQSITFLKYISLNSTEHDNNIKLQLPGDISSYAKNEGPRIPVWEAIFSLENIILLLGFVTLWLIISWLLRPKIKNQN